MKIEQCEKGFYYIVTLANDTYQFKYTGDDYNMGYIRNGSIYGVGGVSAINNSSFRNCDYRPCNKPQIRHIDACIRAGKFVPFTDIGNGRHKLFSLFKS